MALKKFFLDPYSISYYFAETLRFDLCIMYFHHKFYWIRDSGNFPESLYPYPSQIRLCKEARPAAVEARTVAVLGVEQRPSPDPAAEVPDVPL